MDALLKPSWLVVHHSATSHEATFQQIRDLHLARNWDDIGYHWLIDWNGTVYQGRSEDFQGAHALGINNISIGICCIGNFDEQMPSESMLRSLDKMCLSITSRFGIEPENIIGHCDVKGMTPQGTETLCPGKNLYALIPRLRETIRQLSPVIA